MLTVGIDIGTSLSSITVLKNGNVEPVRVKTGDSVFGDSFSMPTVVYADTDGSIKLGQMAFNKQAREPERFKKDFKRVFGTTTPFILGDGQYLPEELYTEIFRHFKKKCEEQYGDKIGTAYITHPASYSNDKKRLIEYAANNAGLSEVILLEEPTAAAIAYSKKEHVATGDVLLVYDLGGQGVAKDYNEAAKWYRKSAEQGYADAQVRLDKITGRKKSTIDVVQKEQDKLEERALPVNFIGKIFNANLANGKEAETGRIFIYREKLVYMRTLWGFGAIEGTEISILYSDIIKVEQYNPSLLGIKFNSGVKITLKSNKTYQFVAAYKSRDDFISFIKHMANIYTGGN